MGLRPAAAPRPFHYLPYRRHQGHRVHHLQGYGEAFSGQLRFSHPGGRSGPHRRRRRNRGGGNRLSGGGEAGDRPQGPGRVHEPGNGRGGARGVRAAGLGRRGGGRSFRRRDRGSPGERRRPSPAGRGRQVRGGAPAGAGLCGRRRRPDDPRTRRSGKPAGHSPGRRPLPAGANTGGRRRDLPAAPPKPYAEFRAEGRRANHLGPGGQRLRRRGFGQRHGAGPSPDRSDGGGHRRLFRRGLPGHRRAGRRHRGFLGRGRGGRPVRDHRDQRRPRRVHAPGARGGRAGGRARDDFVPFFPHAGNGADSHSGGQPARRRLLRPTGGTGPRRPARGAAGVGDRNGPLFRRSVVLQQPGPRRERANRAAPSPNRDRRLSPRRRRAAGHGHFAPGRGRGGAGGTGLRRGSPPGSTASWRPAGDRRGDRADAPPGRRRNRPCAMARRRRPGHGAGRSAGAPFAGAV